LGEIVDLFNNINFRVISNINALLSILYELNCTRVSKTTHNKTINLSTNPCPCPCPCP
jgi:hypothetical protein